MIGRLLAIIFVFQINFAIAGSTTICIQPIFKKEMQYRVEIFGGKNPDEAMRKATELNAMMAKYCKLVKGTPQSDKSEWVGDNCTQETGIYKGKRVYWGECRE